MPQQRRPTQLTALTTLGPTLTREATDVSDYFIRPGTCIGPTEADNARLEHLRRNAAARLAAELLAAEQTRRASAAHTAVRGLTTTPATARTTLSSLHQ